MGREQNGSRKKQERNKQKKIFFIMYPPQLKAENFLGLKENKNLMCKAGQKTRDAHWFKYNLVN